MLSRSMKIGREEARTDTAGPWVLGCSVWFSEANATGISRSVGQDWCFKSNQYPALGIFSSCRSNRVRPGDPVQPPPAARHPEHLWAGGCEFERRGQ